MLSEPSNKTNKRSLIHVRGATYAKQTMHAHLAGKIPLHTLMRKKKKGGKKCKGQ